MAMTASTDTPASKTSDAARKKGEKHRATPFPLFDPGDLTDASARNLDYATRAARACFSGAAQFNWELADFMNRRFQKDIANARSFMTAKTSKNAFHAQAAFVEEMLRDYADETSKLLHMAADTTNSALAPFEKRTEEVLEELDERGDA